MCCTSKSSETNTHTAVVLIRGPTSLNQPQRSLCLSPRKLAVTDHLSSDIKHQGDDSSLEWGVQCTGNSPVFAVVSLTETAWKFGEHHATQIASQRRRETITHVNKSVTKWLSDLAVRIASSPGGVMLIWGKDDRNASLLYLSWFVFLEGWWEGCHGLTLLWF